jgi:hypothetical protein
MSTLAEPVMTHDPDPAIADSLVLVQDDLVIATYAGQQDDAALDLARVLCRAIGRPVEIFRVPQSHAYALRAGVLAPVHERCWRRFARVHSSLLGGVQVEPGESESHLQQAHG